MGIDNIEEGNGKGGLDNSAAGLGGRRGQQEECACQS
jgi:hypothetical protein